MPTNSSQQREHEHFVITRIFDAPRKLVWDAWTVPNHISAWLGPKGAAPARIIRHELREDGVFLSAMKMPDGSEMCGKFVYREVSPIARLVWIHSFADVNGDLVRHPMSPTWPLELLTTVTFADLGNKTEVTLDWIPLNADEVERRTFADGMAGMNGGWTGSFDQLVEHLVQMQQQ